MLKDYDGNRLISLFYCYFWTYVKIARDIDGTYILPMSGTGTYCTDNNYSYVLYSIIYAMLSDLILQLYPI